MDCHITHAEKVEGVSLLGNEPYIDILLHTTDKRKIGVSCKGTCCPSLAGGGLKGLKSIDPNLVDRLFGSIEDVYSGLGFKQSFEFFHIDIPDLFFQIPKDSVKRILSGTEEMGGPIDYMYIGPMEIEHSLIDNVLYLNGKFKSIDEYAEKELFFRIRQRDSKDKILTMDFQTYDREGYPFIHRHGKKKTSRIVITDFATGNLFYKIL